MPRLPPPTVSTGPYELLVVGAGGMGREAADVARATGHRVVIADHGPCDADLRRLRRLEIPFVGSPAVWLAAHPTSPWLLGIGRPAARRRVDAELSPLGGPPTVVVHPAATVGSDVRLGPGTIVCAGARISTNVETGRHAHVGSNAAVGHDSVLGAWTSVNPGALVSGSVRLGDEALVGAGAVVLQGLDLAPGCTIGAAACVVRDVTEAVVVKGVPAR